jgi:hypothetical protein
VHADKQLVVADLRLREVLSQTGLDGEALEGEGGYNGKLTIDVEEGGRTASGTVGLVLPQVRLNLVGAVEVLAGDGLADFDTHSARPQAALTGSSSGRC